MAAAAAAAAIAVQQAVAADITAAAELIYGMVLHGAVPVVPGPMMVELQFLQMPELEQQMVL